MHLTRLFASVLLGHQLASAALPANLCPDAVIIQPVVVVDQSPVLVNGFFPHDTSLLINGIAVPITNAPISLSTVITGSSSSAATLTSGAGLSAATYTTLTGYFNGPAGSEPKTITFPPSQPGGTGTVIVESPAPSAFNGPYTTVTGGYDGSVTRSLTLPPAGTDTIGTVIVETPAASNLNGPAAFTGPYTTLTGGYDGSVTQTFTLDPAGTDTVGTIIIETPASGVSAINGPAAFTGPYTTITGGYGGSTTLTLTLAPTGSDTVGTVVVETPTTGNSPFTGPYTTISGGYGGTTTLTVTLPPSGTGTVGTVIVQTPTSSSVNGAAPTSSESTGATGASNPSSSTSSPTTSAESSPSSTASASTSPPATTCFATVTSTPSSQTCATGLPQACESLSSSSGLALIPLVPLCLAALGPFAVGNVATCLTTDTISVTTAGTTIVSCLNTALSGTCISSLPAACSNLSNENGLALVADVPACVVALGPFAVGEALVCLSTSSIAETTTGASIITCLNNALKLTSATPTTSVVPTACPAASSTPSSGCQVSLPPNCANLASVSGLDLIVDVPLCLTALGVYGVGNAAACLATDVITTSTTGGSIINCLNTALEASCPTSLPSACTKLNSDNGSAALLVDIPLCVVALGPFAAGNAAVCLSTTTLTESTTGSSIVECLEKALGISL
ncbi:uncharacterized protein E0L32_006335 [Thyridium curvatum]|uniref:Uncharacterized protein n=1 Tax=Thyridium curvatum TaxID=1093900 RepID=A0A507ATQ4_9PEZI|nr:uncharacterized protein E0L32_006335 [Thyridium curvatum]TPX13362.1 hypothetical protein E0L32_006335 [Thyridium curvatum]